MKRQLEGNARKQYFARLRHFKKLCLFQEVPTAEEFAKLSTLESAILEDIWGLLPPSAISAQCLEFSIHQNPLSFLPSYCSLARLFETFQFRLFNALPLRTSLIQSHVTIDTTILYSHILLISRQEAEAAGKEALWGRVVNSRCTAFKRRGAMTFSERTSVWLKAEKEIKGSDGKGSCRPIH